MSAVERAKQALEGYPTATVSLLDMVNERVGSIFDAAIDVMGLHMLITDVDRKKYLANVNASLIQGAPALFFRESYNEAAHSGKVSSAGFIVDQFIDMDPSREIWNSASIYVHKGGAK